MKKAELIKHLAETTGITQKAIGEVFAELETVILNNASAGADTVLGLLTVTVVKKEARMGRNPATGQAQEIPARNAIKVKVAKPLKDAANWVAK